MSDLQLALIAFGVVLVVAVVVYNTVQERRARRQAEQDFGERPPDALFELSDRHRAVARVDRPGRPGNARIDVLRARHAPRDPGGYDPNALRAVARSIDQVVLGQSLYGNCRHAQHPCHTTIPRALYAALWGA